MALSEIADELGVSKESLTWTNLYIIQKQLISAMAATATGDVTTATTASTTTYNFLGMLPKAGTLIQAIVRFETKADHSSKLDIFKVPSGTAVASGTAMVTQVDCTAVTNATNYGVAINTDGSQNVAAGASIVAKLQSVASEGAMTDANVMLVFKL